MIKTFVCPICGKSYTDAADMANCLIKCDKAMKSAEAESEVARIKAEKAIMEKYEWLKKDIEAYNKTYTNDSFNIRISHTGKQTLRTVHGWDSPKEDREKVINDATETLKTATETLKKKLDNMKNSETLDDILSLIFGEE